MMQCVYNPLNTEIVNILTNNQVNENQPEHHSVGEIDRYHSNILTNCTSDFVSFDNVLRNLAKEMYVEKLLQLAYNNEQRIIEYRSFLSIKAKAIERCPKGNLIQRKNTKTNPSSVRYAKDCFALYMFCYGDNSYVFEVFDKRQDAFEILSTVNIDLHNANTGRTCARTRDQRIEY
jgi:hypothetical protein